MSNKEEETNLTEERKKEIKKEIKDIVSKNLLETLSDQEISQWKEGKGLLVIFQSIDEHLCPPSEIISYQKLTPEEALEYDRLGKIIYPKIDSERQKILSSDLPWIDKGAKAFFKALDAIRNTPNGKRLKELREKAVLKDRETKRGVAQWAKQLLRLTFFLYNKKGYKGNEVKCGIRVWEGDYWAEIEEKIRENYQKRAGELEAKIERLTKKGFGIAEIAERLAKEGYETKEISRELGFSIDKYEELKKTPPALRDFYPEDINLLQIPIAYHGKMATPKTKYVEGNYVVLRDIVKSKEGVSYPIETKVGSPDGYLTSYDEDLFRGICSFTEYEKESKQYISHFSRWELAKALGWEISGGADSERIHKGLEKIGLMGLKHNRFYNGETEAPETIEITFFKKARITHKENKDRDNFFIWSESFTTNLLRGYYKNLRLSTLLALSTPTSKKLFECLEGAFGKRKKQYSIRWRKLCPKISIFDEDPWSAKETLIKACGECKEQGVISEYWFSRNNNEVINFSRKHKTKEDYQKEEKTITEDQGRKVRVQGQLFGLGIESSKVGEITDKYPLGRIENLLKETPSYVKKPAGWLIKMLERNSSIPDTRQKEKEARLRAGDRE